MKHFDPKLRDELCAILRAGQIEDAALEARWILEDAADELHAVSIAKRRAKHEPLQYLLGAWEFYGLRIEVGEGVLIPRADTETLVETAVSFLRQNPAPRVIDLCTGSGCAALAVRSCIGNAEVTGIDISEAALSYARRNGAALFPDVQFLCADVTAPETAAQFSEIDCILCNPPYLTAEDMANLQTEVTYEPALALSGGKDGLDFYRSITALWRDTLKKGGMLAYEAGISQHDAVADILRENGFADIRITPDYNGVMRVISGIRTSCMIHSV